MKKIILLLTVLTLSITGARADEGMWFLKLMERQHLADSLRRAGLELPPEALYSETSPSLRQCIGVFGGGCTGEVVSADGLVLTNHHCGFSYVHAISGIGHDYMKDGFFAHSREEEMPMPEDLTFTFVLAVEDVTEAVRQYAQEKGADVYDMQTRAFLRPLAKEMLKKSKYAKTKGVFTDIVPYFSGNEFYLFYYQTYEDIRLVANPPYNVGQFGGNGDNWMWPRHSADFAMFRIYADKKGRPAPYSKDNVPLRVDKFLPISLAGPQLGDYTMIMGFPGSTNRYLTASEVTLRCEGQNAPIVLAGNPLLDYYKRLMDQSDRNRLLLEDKYFSIGNVVKNYGGMNEAVEKTHLVDLKKAEEARFREFAVKSGKAEYADIIDRIDSFCTKNADFAYDTSLSLALAYATPLEGHNDLVAAYVEAVRGGKAKEITEAAEALRDHSLSSLRDIDPAIEEGSMRLLLPYFVNNHRLSLAPSYATDEATALALVDSIFHHSVLTDSTALDAALAAADTTALKNDPLVRYLNANAEYDAARSPDFMKFLRERKKLDNIYVRGLCEMYDWSKAPDANFTLRMTYGHTADLRPRDAVRYDWRTVLDGMFEKESKTNTEYFVNERLRELYEKGDFGPYAREDGKLPTCFLSDNDITGGNSGSPVMNARGELIGLAFDGNIESLSSDLKFNPELQRCVNVDIRYVLFMIDKFGGSRYVLDELDIRR